VAIRTWELNIFHIQRKPTCKRIWLGIGEGALKRAKQSNNHARIRILIQVKVFWVVMPCSLVVAYQRTLRHNPQDLDLKVYEVNIWWGVHPSVHFIPLNML